MTTAHGTIGEEEAHALLQQVRSSDYDRFLAIQLAPPEKRAALYAITAVHIELARIAEIVSEPMIGHIRLAWWREALAEIEAGKTPRNHPVVRALAALYPTTPKLFALLALTIDARAADLDTSLIAQEAAWRDYCTNTAGALHLAFAHVLDAGAAETHADLIREQGQAYAMIGLVRAIPFMAAQGWLRFDHARLNAHGLTSLAPAPALPAFARMVVEDAAARLPEQRLPQSLKPLRALSELARHHAAQLKKAGYDPYRLRPSKLLMVWRVFCLNIM
jgi:phytoene/squalene synthetase